MKQRLEIFFVFFKIGLFTLGGGYAMLPIIQKEVVESKRWMTDEEFLDAVSMANSLPGPMATNSATFVGYRICRTPGAVAAILGAALPSVLIILLVAMVFQNLVQYPLVQNIFNGIRPAVVALIFYSVVKLARSARIGRELNWMIAILSFLAVAVFALHPVTVVLAGAAYGLFLRRRLLDAIQAHKKGKGDAPNA